MDAPASDGIRIVKPPSKRELVLGHMRVAGHENDRKAWMRLYTENKISLAVAEDAWRNGRAAAMRDSKP